MKKRGPNGGYIPVVSGYGVGRPIQEIYSFPEKHRCHGCPYTLQSNVPSCMFPARADGGCFWYDIKNNVYPAKNPKGGEPHA